MATIPESCWQIAAGNTDRNYADLCIELGVIIMGPGSGVPWYKDQQKESEIELKNAGWTTRKINNIGVFAHEIKEKDLIVLRLGKSTVCAVGFVRSPYEHNMAFDDVDGWDLCHLHRVEWVWSWCNLSDEEKNNNYFKFKDSLNFGPTTQKLDQNSNKTQNLFEWIKGLPEPIEKRLPDLPKESKYIEFSDIFKKLYAYGISTITLSSLKQKVEDLIELAIWYTSYENPSPTESETVTHLVVPLLQALGWTPQQTALELAVGERKKADLALYGYGNRKDEYITMIVEAKKFNNSCLTADKQVRNYAVGKPNVSRLVVTDGIRYGIFLKDKDATGGFSKWPNAYLNLSSLRDKYEIYGECGGADDTLLYLNSLWNPEYKHPDVKTKKEDEDI